MKTTRVVNIVAKLLSHALCRQVQGPVSYARTPVNNMGHPTLFMKMIVLLLFSLILNSKCSYAQTITLNKKNATLESIFFEISKQTGFSFFYEEAQLRQAEKVTINVKDKSLKEVLDICFRNQPFTYTIGDSSINLVSQDSVRQNSTLVHNSITGKIMDMNGMPLPGTNIKIKGIANGAIADASGSFVLNGVTPNITLLVSHIGYEPKEIELNGEKTVDIRLEQGLKILDEVITNGYRSTTRRDNLGTSTKISAEEINRQPVNNPLAAMQAKIPGMIVTQRSGLPGTPFTVQIRGQRSVGTTSNVFPANSPLFIIDGVPFLSSSEMLTQRSRINANSPFSTINPADIESIEVLKDANATSIYGSLGANGVVLITTKKSKTGKTTVDVNLYSGFGKITRAHDYMNTKQYVGMRNEAFAMDGEPADLFNAPDLLLWDTTRYTNWKKTLIGGTARIYNAHVNLSGGSELTQFSLGFGYNKEKTVYPGDHGKSLTSVNLNVSHITQDKKFELVFSTSYGYDKSNLVSRDPTEAIATPPNAPSPYKEMGQLNWEDNGYPFNNPLSFLHQPYNFIMERLTSGLRLNYKVTPWLNLKTSAGYTVITGDETLVLPIASQNPILNPTGQASFGTSKNKNWIVEPQLEFARHIGNRGKLKAIVGTSFRERTGETKAQDGTGYTNDATLYSIEGATNVVSDYGYMQYRVVSGYGLINYKFNNKFIFEATTRRDGSSRFGPDRKFANFASIAGGWIFSDEKFIKQTLPFLSFGKLRTSYGTTGNDQIGDYQFLDGWATSRLPYQLPSLLPTHLANSKYRWELQKSLDIGIDLGFFKDRIFAAATWNHSRTSDQLISFSLPAQAGFTTVIKNFPAVVQNRNLEFELNTINIRNTRFKWTSSLNLSIQKNKLLKFPGIESTIYGKNSLVVGQPLNLAWGYRTTGVDPSTGIFRFVNDKGQEIPVTFTTPAETDKVNFGTYNPDFFGGFQNSIEYGNWQLHILFQFVKQMGRHSVYSTEFAPGSILFNQPLDVLKRWQTIGNTSRYQRYTQNPGSLATFAWIYHSASDAVFTDASFIRLKNLSFSYHFPRKWKEKLKLTNCRIYIQAQNVFTLTKFKGNDPEIYTNPFGLPPLRLFTAGIQASL